MRDLNIWIQHAEAGAKVLVVDSVERKEAADDPPDEKIQKSRRAVLLNNRSIIKCRK